MSHSILYPIRRFGAVSAILLIAAGLLYWEIAVGIQLEEGLAWDEPIMLALHSLSRPLIDMVFYWITKTVEFFMIIPLLAMVIYLTRRAEYSTAVLLILSAITFPLMSLILKNQFGRPRQDIFISLVDEHTYSFPSGHTLTAVAVYGFIAVLLWQRGHRVWAAISGFWVLLVGLSRVYLGAHYPSDVLASLALGTCLLIIVLFIDSRLKVYLTKRKERAGQPDG